MSAFQFPEFPSQITLPRLRNTELEQYSEWDSSTYFTSAPGFACNLFFHNGNKLGIVSDKDMKKEYLAKIN